MLSCAVHNSASSCASKENHKKRLFIDGEEFATFGHLNIFFLYRFRLESQLIIAKLYGRLRQC